ncbi:MAG: hypothetical protein LBI02_08095 [Opitutaceae bacterium]|nr:hypothetical protein [Opitutaceae bacterium]
MKSKHCGSEKIVKNGLSRHGHQRWVCRECRKTQGEKEHRRVDESRKQSALNPYL